MIQIYTDEMNPLFEGGCVLILQGYLMMQCVFYIVLNATRLGLGVLYVHLIT